MESFRTDPLCLVGSRDTLTGQVYFPPRALSADGALRETETVELSRQGTLYTWTRFAGTSFGQIDLPEGVRIQTLLDDDAPVIGATYEITGAKDPSGATSWRFARA